MAAVADSIRLRVTPPVQYVLRLADTCLVHAQRQAEWCGHGPVLEEDIALTNLTLDCIGQARALLTHAGRLEGQGYDEDQLAFLREERQFYNLTLVEQPSRQSSAHTPGGDFADVVVRNLLLSGWLMGLWDGLLASTDAQLAAIAAKSMKETRYHRQHAGDWAVRLGDGTDESSARMRAALQRAWPYTAEMFAADAVDEAAVASGLGPSRGSLREAWQAGIAGVLHEAHLPMPETTPFVSTGTQGVHSEHMGFVLAEMQSLQRQFPGGRW
ncbi:MAG: phenylacetate-CoA oxygenase subunit PaaC [Rubrivivax sp.]|jgi:ring-1,2-phenylacetyl-CoA epoxidase subunit PaaC|nr:phenylacetate-CoA oxygenase subunit PaaC [Rubrivivax sp.]